MSEKTPTSTGYVVSDLHIFGCSSLYERHLPAFYQAVASHAVTVLNGDVFDFKRSIYPSSAETTHRAIEWLRALSERAPHCTIFYLLGNHDSHASFVRSLHETLPHLKNVSLASDFLRLGPILFLHGDVVDLPSGANDITVVRSRYAHVEPSSSSRAFAHLVSHLRINAVEHLRHSRAALAQRIMRYLDATQPGYRETVREIYFGHTHVPIGHFNYEGITFRNTGSMIRGLPWRPMEFSIDAATGITEQTILR